MYLLVGIELTLSVLPVRCEVRLSTGDLEPAESAREESRLSQMVIMHQISPTSNTVST